MVSPALGELADVISRIESVTRWGQRGWRCALFTVILGAAGASNCAAEQPSLAIIGSPSIWFSPLTWEISKQTKHIDYSSHDFPALLQPGSTWQHAASLVGVVTLQANVVWSYPNRAAVVGFFHDHQFKTAFSFGMLFDDGECPYPVEGVSHDHDFNREAVNIAKTWKEAGGNIDYVVMDAPLLYGHFGERRCTHSIDDVARRVAATLGGIRRYFPNVAVVDAEGTGRVSEAEWRPMMEEWFSSFSLHAGLPIAAVALDLNWQHHGVETDWKGIAQRSAILFRQHGIMTGLIVNDDRTGPAVTDMSWMDENRSHIREIAQANGLGLDFIAINSWMGHPQNNLPETDPAAYTSLIDFAYKMLHSK